MKSLTRLLNDSEAFYNDTDSKNSPEKVVHCPKCNKDYRVPGYTIDYVCQCTNKVTELDVSKLTVNMANMQRDLIIKSEARDIVLDAVPHPPSNDTNKINRV